MPKRDPRMIPLGYGKFARADRIFALVPLEREERREGRRTYVHVDGLTQPIVASRSERAILTDVEAALAEAALWSGVGAEVDVPDGEHEAGQAVLACAPEHVPALTTVPIKQLGVVGGDELLGVALAKLQEAYG